MKISKEEKVTYTLVLDKKEALLLKSLVQNLIYNVEDEPSDMKELRKNLFNNLPDFDHRTPIYE